MKYLIIFLFAALPFFAQAQILRAYGVIDIGASFPIGTATGAKFAYKAIDSSYYRWVSGNTWVKILESSINPDTLYLKQLSGTTALVDGDTIDISTYFLKSDTTSAFASYLKRPVGWGLSLLTGKYPFVDSSKVASRYYAGTNPTTIAANYAAVSNGTNLIARNLFDNNTYAGVISRPWKFGEWTTAGRPTGVLGYFGFNTSDNIPEWYNGSAWDQMHTPWTQSSVTTSIPFNLTTNRYVYFTPDVSFGTGPFGFQYNNNNDFRFGLQAGARIQFQDAGGIATMSGTWNFPANATYPANAYLAGYSSASNDVRWVVTRSGTGASQTIYAYTQRNSVADNAPRLYQGASSFAWGTRNNTTPWNNSADSTKAFMATNGDFWLGNASYGGLGSYPSITTQARLNIIGRGTSTTYPLLLLENLGGTDRFSVLENGEVRIPVLSATPTRIVGADADGDLGSLTLSGLSISSGVLSAQSIYNLLPSSDVQISAASNSLRLNSLDTMKMNHAIITTPGTTNLLLLNPNVGSLGYPSGFGGGFHTVINGTMATTSPGTGHLVIGGIVNDGIGANFATSVGYSSNVGGEYAIGLGYDADATGLINSMAIGYGARADEDYEISLGSNNYGKLNLWTNTGDIFAKGDVIAEDSVKVTTRPSMPSATDIAVYDASGWLGYRTISSLSDGNGIYSNSGTLANHTTRALIPETGNLLFSQTYNTTDSAYIQFVNNLDGNREIQGGLTDTASTGFSKFRFYQDEPNEEMGWEILTSDGTGTTAVGAQGGNLSLYADAIGTVEIRGEEMRLNNGSVLMNQYGQDNMKASDLGQTSSNFVAGYSTTGRVVDFQIRKDTFTEDASVTITNTSLGDCSELFITTSMTNLAAAHLVVSLPTPSASNHNKRVSVWNRRKDAGLFVPVIDVTGGGSTLYYTANTATTAPSDQATLTLDGTTWHHFGKTYVFNCVKINATDYRWVLDQR